MKYQNILKFKNYFTVSFESSNALGRLPFNNNDKIDIMNKFEVYQLTCSILERSDNIGVKRDSAKLLKCFLSKRPQEVRIGDIHNYPLKSQYAIIGPILFTIYTNKNLNFQ